MDLSANGLIPIDDFQNTNIETIYALGDITGRSPLTPVAATSGRRLADRFFGGQVLARLEDSTLQVYPAVCISCRTASPHEFSLANACKQLLHGGCGYSSTPTG